MNRLVLVATLDRKTWGVELNGIEVVSFCGPHAYERALHERDELDQLLSAVAGAHPPDRPT
jgi:hypothetical protein